MILLARCALLNVGHDRVVCVVVVVAVVVYLLLTVRAAK